MSSPPPTALRILIVSRLLLFSLLLIIAIAGLEADPGHQTQTEQSSYDGLPDPRLVPLLKSISSRAGREQFFAQDGRYLYDLIVRNRLTSGLEVGDSKGYAAIWLGMAFRRTGGRMICIAHAAAGRRETLANLNQAMLLDRIDLHLNDAFERVPSLPGPFDFVLLDGQVRDYEGFMAMILPKVSPGGVIAAHDVAGQRRNAAEFIRAVTGNPLLQTELVALSPAGLSITRKLVKHRN
jgi:predicted O-methyltransferase YrrM